MQLLRVRYFCTGYREPLRPHQVGLIGGNHSLRGVKTINDVDFYDEYRGHKIGHLETVVGLFTQCHKLPATSPNSCPDTSIVFLLGDSSLDNKHWLYPTKNDKGEPDKASLADGSFTAPAVNGYEKVVGASGRMVKDVCYWLNRKSAESSNWFKQNEDVEVPVKEHPYPHLLFVNSAVEESTLSSRASGLLSIAKVSY